jgi:hypothetical protein
MLAYWLNRIYTAAFGALMITSILFTAVFQLHWEMPTLFDDALLYVPWLVGGCILLLPNSWTAAGMLFYIRLVIYLSASLWLIYSRVEEVYDFRYSPIDMLANVPFLLVALTAPTCLIMSKRRFPKSY